MLYYFLRRGMVSMVAQRSPKPSVRVRVLLPLPNQNNEKATQVSRFIFFRYVFLRNSSLLKVETHLRFLQ